MHDLCSVFRVSVEILFVGTRSSMGARTQRQIEITEMKARSEGEAQISALWLCYMLHTCQNYNASKQHRSQELIEEPSDYDQA